MGNDKDRHVQGVSATPPVGEVECPPSRHQRPCRFARLAKERGLNVVVTSAGTEPDAQVAPAVAAHLARQGYAAQTAPPRKVTAEDLAQADLVISLGCDLSGLPKPRGKLVTWDDVPAPSANFTAADDAIRAKVITLVDELVREGAPKRP